ncbi:MAG: hypothetical protein JSR71_03675 [Proteobacteria bacterium]|nr:hypothetical protein [Pseudomonadota bacterium]
MLYCWSEHRLSVWVAKLEVSVDCFDGNRSMPWLFGMARIANVIIQPIGSRHQR